MKVLHVLYSKIYTGAEKVAAQIIKAFEGRVDMAYCSLECEEVWEILDGMGIRHYGVEELTPATLSTGRTSSMPTTCAPASSRRCAAARYL